MATTLTSNIKLIVDDSLTTASRTNLFKIDTLGSLYQTDANANARIRSQRDIFIQPQDPDIGGTGTGGSINLGTVDQPATDVSLYATTFNVNANLSSSTLDTTLFNLTNSGFSIGIQAPLLTNNITLTLPANDGTINQVLTTNGTGILSWTTVVGAGSFGAELTSSWVAGEGTTKTVTHNFNDRNIIVQVVDPNDSYRTIEVDEVTRPTNNTVVITGSSAPDVNWTVLLKQIL